MIRNTKAASVLASSKVTKKMAPGQPGTKLLLDRYGKQLLCVRYRVSANGLKRLVTVEIVVAEHNTKSSAKRLANTLVAVRVPRSNLGLSRLIWEQGGAWDPVNTVWWVQASVIESLGITHRVVQNA